VVGCAALVAPDPLPPSHVYRGPDLTQAYGVCNPGWIGFDRNGFVGFAGLREVYDPDQGPLVSGVDLSILAPAGSTVAKQSFPDVSDNVGPFIQPGGAGIVAQDSSAESTLITVEESGAFRQRSIGRVPWYALDAFFSGGTVAVEGGFFAFADGGTVKEPQTVTRRDENLDPLWSWKLGTRADPADTVVAFANATDHVLVLVTHLTAPRTSTQKGYWLDGSGQLVRSFDSPGFGFLGVAKLVDGALAFQSNDPELIQRPWVGYIPDLEEPAPVPDWLAGRPETRVAIIRGGLCRAARQVPKSRRSVPGGGRDARWEVLRHLRPVLLDQRREPLPGQRLLESRSRRNPVHGHRGWIPRDLLRRGLARTLQVTAH
jgi:hypothetical protein